MGSNIIILGFSVAAIGGWIDYSIGGSIYVAMACTLFAVGNILLVLLGTGVIK